ncbi:tRNA (N(6)-L-threonylcarbamoyladenosine(37)-C(2))-methylthiotransferase MtaB [Candidatus Aerophobetes bacterium]|nr:tRNA (N(6)-L-threonylcarbamoyladenosine(37)-C(2))-methylthiotransferase MtaB [Candidatus Aerophobetes bacterium]
MLRPNPQFGYMPGVALATVGCKTNQYETQVIKERLERAGCKIVPFSSSADIYIINTCTVTSRADGKSIYLARQAARKNSRAKILLTGCMIEAEAENIKKKIPRAKIIKNQDKLKIESLLFPQTSLDGNFLIHSFAGHERAFIKIEDGCNQLCTYCKVPYVRGTNICSRHPDDIMREIKNLDSAGYREIVLTGVNLALYGKDFTPPLSLIHLLEMILPNLSGGVRIRLSSLEPHLIPPGLLNLFSSSSNICPHLHLSLQSGDDEILKKMGRKYTASQVERLVADFRQKIPALGVTADIIVGFPGETQDNFQNTLHFVKELEVHRLHIFPFSPRPETSAFRMKPEVPEVVKKKRSNALRELSLLLSHEFIHKFIGKSLPVLVEGKKDLKTGFYPGYTHNYIKVLIHPQAASIHKLRGSIVSVKILQAKPGFALGKLELTPSCN